MDFKRYFLNSKVYIQQFNSDWTYQNVQNVFVMQNKIQVGLNYVNAISSNHVMNKTCLPLHFFTQFLSYFSQLIYWVFSVIYWVIHWCCSQLFPLLFIQFHSYLLSSHLLVVFSVIFTDFLSYRCQNCFWCWAQGYYKYNNELELTESESQRWMWLLLLLLFHLLLKFRGQNVSLCVHLHFGGLVDVKSGAQNPPFLKSDLKTKILVPRSVTRSRRLERTFKPHGSCNWPRDQYFCFQIRL